MKHGQFCCSNISEKLQRKRFRNPIRTELFNDMSYKTRYEININIEITSLISHLTKNLNCNMLPKTTTDLPTNHIDYAS